uniref:TATA box-binding protein-associated factor RNA polymerase I subunit B n=1 Tax=Steinernema glaseri TaxID=37863 RepID=A0A1I7Z242_9BILA
MDVCGVCGGTNLNEVDGFFYCGTCGTQTDRVYEHDDNDAIPMISRGLILQKGAKEGERKRGGRARRDEVMTKEAYLGNRAQSNVEFPKYLQQCGYRIGTFVKLLHHYGEILVRDFNIDECIIPKIRYIVQRYLRLSGAAFCDSEIAEKEEDRFSIMLKKTSREIRIEKRAHEDKVKKRRLEKKKADKLKAKQVSADAAMSQFIGSQLSEDEEEHKRIEEEQELKDAMFDVNIFSLISTNLSRKAVIASGNALLDVDLILVILYLACATSGVSWVLLSDITRWYREGRFPITKSQMLAITFATGMEDVCEGNQVVNATVRQRFKNHAIQPLYETSKVFHAMVQMVDLPQEVVFKPNFTQILARYVYNLNLPTSFMRQLMTLDKLLGGDPEVSQQRSHMIYPFITNNIAAYLQEPKIATQLHYGSVSFFRYLSFVKPRYHEAMNPRLQTVMISTEGRAMALILFALKLMFGLDDVREYSFGKEEGQNTFNIARYMLQLRLRMDVLRGTSVATVLSKGYTPTESDPLLDEDSFADDKRSEWCFGRKGSNRSNCFEKCIPSFEVNTARDKAFFNLFQDDFQDTARTDFVSNDAVFAPLRYAATKNQSWLTEISRRDDATELLDKSNVQVFFKSYSEQQLTYRNLEEYVPSGPFKERVKNDAACDNGTKTSKWRSLFPSSATYHVYPRIPDICLYTTTKSEAFDEAEVYPLPLLGDVESMHRDAKPCFSKNFEFLLKTFSAVVGEPVYLVYFAVVMVEMMVFERTRISELESSLLGGQPLKTKPNWRCASQPGRPKATQPKNTEKKVIVRRNWDYWEIYLVGDTEAPRWTWKYAAHNPKKPGRANRWNYFKLSLDVGMPLLFWRHC